MDAVDEAHQCGPLAVESAARNGGLDAESSSGCRPRVKSAPANQASSPSSRLHESRCSAELRIDEALLHRAAMRARDRPGEERHRPRSMRSNTSFSSSGGIAEPSA